VEENKPCESRGLYFLRKGSENCQLGTESLVRQRKVAVVTECYISR
jgi:hypothetical protein